MSLSEKATEGPNLFERIGDYADQPALFDSLCLLQQPVEVWSFTYLLIHLLLSEYHTTILLGLCFFLEKMS